MRYVDVTVSVVDCITGISSQETNIDRMRAEDDRSIRENYPLMYWLMWMPKKLSEYGVKKDQEEIAWKRKLERKNMIC